jgi:hypothetical protein
MHVPPEHIYTFTKSKFRRISSCAGFQISTTQFWIQRTSDSNFSDFKMVSFRNSKNSTDIRNWGRQSTQKLNSHQGLGSSGCTVSSSNTVTSLERGAVCHCLCIHFPGFQISAFPGFHLISDFLFLRFHFLAHFPGFL